MHNLARFALLVLVALPLFAAKHRAVSVPQTREVTLVAEVVDAENGKPVVEVDVLTPSGSLHADTAGRVTVTVPLGQPVAFTFSRTGYETLTEVVTVDSDSRRTFRMTSKPTTLARTRSGKTYELDASSLEFGHVVPFLGYSKAAEIKACRSGGGEVVLNNDTVRKLTGPAFSNIELACCPRGTPVGLEVELTSGERVRAYFTDFCEARQTEIIARDHATWQLVFIPVTDLAELTVRQ
jgi:transcriptional antiterminator Rof (Rho-off)